MIEFLFDFGPFVIPMLLIGLGYLAWGRDKKWAKLAFFALLILLIGAAILLGLFVIGLGQANWSL